MANCVDTGSDTDVKHGTQMLVIKINRVWEAPQKKVIKVGTLHRKESCHFGGVWDYFLKWESEMTSLASLVPPISTWGENVHTAHEEWKIPFLLGSPALADQFLPFLYLVVNTHFQVCVESAEHSSASYTLVGLKAMEKGKGEKQQGESSDFLSHNTALNSAGHLGWFGCELKAPDPQSSLILCWPGGEFGNKGQDSSSSSHQERIVTRPHWAEASADTHCGFDSAYLPSSHPPISHSPPPPPLALSPEWSAHSKSPTEVEMIGSPVFID